jgi:hypothetical protein
MKVSYSKESTQLKILVGNGENEVASFVHLRLFLLGRDKGVPLTIRPKLLAG